MARIYVVFKLKFRIVCKQNIALYNLIITLFQFNYSGKFKTIA